MKSKAEIIDEMARARLVEKMVENIAHQPLGADLKDLCQMVYLALIEYSDEKIVGLWTAGQMRYFVARIILNQFRSSNSPYHQIFRRYQAKAQDISEYDWPEE